MSATDDARNDLDYRTLVVELLETLGYCPFCYARPMPGTKHATWCSLADEAEDSTEEA